MIYSDTTILRRVQARELGISPFYMDRLNPASYDVTLGKKVLVFRSQMSLARRMLAALQLGSVHDIRDEPDMVEREIGPRGLVLWPGMAYLLATAETFDIPGDSVAVFDGKSSLGRLFIKVHETAGYVDPRFKGHITAEVTSMLPIRIYAGMRMGQIRFETLTEPPLNTYDKVGHYRGHRAEGPVPSYFWATLKERPSPFAAVMVVEDPVGRYLAVSRPYAGPENIGMPGGKIDPGETPEAAAIRETYEETGVKVDQCSYLGEVEIGFGEKVAFYRAQRWSGAPHQKEDAVQVRWADYEEFTRPCCTFASTYRDWLPEKLNVPL